MVKLLVGLNMIFLTSCVGINLHTESTLSGVRDSKLDREAEERGVDKRKFSEKDVIDILGEPIARRVQSQGFVELDYYTDDIAWRGMTIWLLLPVPILLPVGYNKTTLTFLNNSLLLEEVQEADSHFWGCALYRCAHIHRLGRT